MARAYIDQLSRSGALAPRRIATLNSAIAKVEASGTNKKDAAALETMGACLDKDAVSAKTPVDASRMRALAEIIKKNTSARP